MTLVVIFSILFSFTVLKNIVLERIGKQNSALLLICEKARSKVQNFLRKNTFQRKKHAFQYLGGYVFCKLYEKFKMARKKYE